MQTEEIQTKIVCPNCDHVNWIDNDEHIKNCENCGELFDAKTQCPNCNGDRLLIDDNDPSGARTCHYCDGKGVVSYDPNLM